jgi:hypothetical protein
MHDGRDEQFQREMRNRAKAAAGGVVLGEDQPRVILRTATEVTFQGTQIGLARLVTEDKEVLQYQIRIMDQFFNTIYILPLEPQGAENFHKDFADLLAGVEDSEPEVQPEQGEAVDG